MGDPIYIKNILTGWELPQFIDLFIAEEFDKETFEKLDYEALRSIIPKAGPRQKFWHKFKHVYVQETSSLCTTLSQPSTDSLSLVDNINSNEMSEVSVNPGNTFQTLREFISISDIPFADSNITIFPKEVQSLRDILNRTTNGALICSFYKKHNTLDKSHKNLLSRIIIHAEVDNCSDIKDFKITTLRFQTLTKQIVEIFPKENENTYFVPYNKITQRNATGKLWESYNSLKKKIKSSIIPVTKTVQVDNSNISESTEAKVSFLKKNIQPFDRIQEFWRDTTIFRKSLLKLSIHEYFEYFPILKSPKGWRLLSQDFDQEYPDASNSMFLLWPKLNKYLITLAETLKKDKEIEAILGSTTDITGLFLLPHLLPTAYSTVKRGVAGHAKRFKYSKQEIFESFILHVTDGNLVTEAVKQKREDSAVFKKTLQPTIILVGDTIAEIRTAYIAVNETLYSFESPLQALDECFKAIISLDAQYPEPSMQIWTFLQLYVYNIKFKGHDKQFTSVHSLMSELKSFED